MTLHPSAVASQPWTQCRTPVERPRLRLLCLPHAGGGTSAYHDWDDALPADVEVWTVRLPGRESRVGERPCDSMPELLDRLGAAVSAWRANSSAPYVLFGHSMGALIAFELARLLSEDEGRSPAALFVSGHGAPHLPAETRFHLLPDDEFLARALDDGVAARGAMDDPQLRELYLPALRADFRLAETYRHSAGDPLTCPIVTWSGDRDVAVAPAEVAQWSGYSSARVKHRVFPGGHFFTADDPARALSSLTADLRALVESEAEPATATITGR